MLPALKSGDYIGVMAPSSYVEKDDIERSIAFIEQRGYHAFIHPQTYERHHQSAGTSAQKIEALHDLYARDDIRAVWAAGGGNRALSLLDHINFDALKAASKPMIGFSDVTALLNGIYAHTGAQSVHGPVFSKLYKHKQADELFKMLGGEHVAIPLGKAHIINDGDAHAAIIGGNLSVFQYLPQTLPNNFCDGAIIFLEDCSEELSRIDRMLYHLKQLGVFDRARGLVFGQFTDMKESGRPFGFSFEDIIREHTQGLDIPIVMNAPFGHGDDLHPIAVGSHMRLNTAERALEPQNF